MKTSESKRKLLKATTALGLSLGLGITEVALSASPVFMKIEDVEGESSDAKHKEWVEIYASVQGNKLILKTRNGKKITAKQGRYRLSNGQIIFVKNGKIIKKSIANLPNRNLKKTR